MSEEKSLSQRSEDAMQTLRELKTLAERCEMKSLMFSSAIRAIAKFANAEDISNKEKVRIIKNLVEDDEDF